MKYNTVQVSIALASFNGERYLRKQLDSIFSQTLSIYEVVVCDDCSTDHTVDILIEYSQKFNLKYFVNEKQLGFVKNFEKAISLCSGNFIALSDQDDIWYSNKIEYLLSEIGDNLLIHSNCSLIDENDQVILHDFKGQINTHKNAVDFLKNNVCTGCTMLFRKELVEYILPFPNGLSYHDWYLGIYAAYLGKIRYTEQILTGYRQHLAQDTGALTTQGESLTKNVLNRLLGKENNAMKGSKKQLNNLLAVQSKFIHDKLFSQEISTNVEYYYDYVNNFFHFKVARHHVENIPFLNKKKGFKKFFYLIKHSIG